MQCTLKIASWFTTRGICRLSGADHTVRDMNENSRCVYPLGDKAIRIVLAMQQPKIALCLWLNEVYQIKELVKLNPSQFISLKSDQ